VLKLSEKHPRYGYRRITALLRRAGLIINPKRVQRGSNRQRQPLPHPDAAR